MRSQFNPVRNSIITSHPKIGPGKMFLKSANPTTPTNTIGNS